MLVRGDEQAAMQALASPKLTALMQVAAYVPPGRTNPLCECSNQCFWPCLYLVNFRRSEPSCRLDEGIDRRPFPPRNGFSVAHEAVRWHLRAAIYALRAPLLARLAVSPELSLRSAGWTVAHEAARWPEAARMLLEDPSLAPLLELKDAKGTPVAKIVQKTLSREVTETK